MLPAPSNTFCILPWIHTYVGPNGDVMPCCIGNSKRVLGNVQSNNIIEIWNNDNYKKLRLNMLAGEQSLECRSCYNVEAAGNESFRQSYTQKYQKYINHAELTNPDGSLDKMELRYFDVRWSNICNFKCRSCSSNYSSSWAIEDDNKGAFKDIFIFAGGTSNDTLYEQFKTQFHNVEEFYFAGGEPLLTDKHYEILENLIETGNTNVELRYNTNLSNLIYKNKSVIDLWKNFPKIEVYVSLDSWGDRAEYIRTGTVWEELENNIRLIQTEAPHVNLQMTSVISAFNVLTVPEFLEYLFKNNLYDHNTTCPSFYVLQNPAFYSFSILPDTLRRHAIDKLQKMQHYNQYITTQVQSIITALCSSKFSADDHTAFEHHTYYYDSLRNTNFLKTFPECTRLYSVD